MSTKDDKKGFKIWATFSPLHNQQEQQPLPVTMPNFLWTWDSNMTTWVLSIEDVSQDFAIVLCR